MLAPGSIEPRGKFGTALPKMCTELQPVIAKVREGA